MISMTPTASPDLTLWPSHAALWGVLRQEAAQRGASLALRHEVLGDFITRLARRAPGGVGSMDPGACLMALREVVRRLNPQLRALPVHDVAFVDHALSAIHAAREAMVSPTDFLRAAGLMPEHRQGPLIALARLYGVYETHKEARGLWDGADALQAATVALEKSPPRLPPVVHIKGLVDITQARLAFLRALSRRTRVIVHLPDVQGRPALSVYLEGAIAALEQTQSAGLELMHGPLCAADSVVKPVVDALFTSTVASVPSVSIAAFPDARAEAEAAAEFCLRRLEEGMREQDVAVVVRRSGPRDELLAEAMEQRGLSLWRRTVDLRGTAYARSVVRLLRARDGRITVEDLEGLAVTGGASPAQSRNFSDALAPRIRAVGPAARAAAILEGTERLPGMVLLNRALQLLPAEGKVEEHVECLEEAVGKLPGINPHGGDEGETLGTLEVLARSAIVGGLRALSRSAERAATGVISASAFLAHVEQVFGSTTLPLTSGGVELVSAPDVVGRAFKAVALVGVADGVFPESSKQNPLLGDDDKEALNTQLGRAAFRTEEAEGVIRSPPRDRLEPLLFAITAAAASEHLLVGTCESTLGAASQTPGPLFLEVLRATGREEPDRPPPPLHQIMMRRLAGRHARSETPSSEKGLVFRHQAMALRASHMGPYSGHLEGEVAALVANKVGGFEPSPTSPSALQTYGDCGFRYLLESILGLKPYEPAADAPAANEVGTVAHKVLEEYHRTRLNQPFAIPTDEEKTWIREQVREKGSKLTGNPDLLRATLEALAERIIATLTRLVAHPPVAGARPVAVEAEFGSRGKTPLEVDLPEVEPVFIKGTIDRVDEDPTGLRVAADYKLGRLSGITSKLSSSSVGFSYLQLPLYLMALEGLGAERSAGYLWSLRDGKASRRLGEAGEYTLNQIMDGTDLKHPGMRVRLVGLVKGLRSGRFPIMPSHGACDFCLFSATCRVNEVGNPAASDGDG